MNAIDFSEFRKRLKILMILNDVDNKKLAEETGFSESYIRNIKSDHEPSLTFLIRLHYYFGVSIDWLLAYSSFDSENIRVVYGHYSDDTIDTYSYPCMYPAFIPEEKETQKESDEDE